MCDVRHWALRWTQPAVIVFLVICHAAMHSLADGQCLLSDQLDITSARAVATFRDNVFLFPSQKVKIIFGRIYLL